jgi:multidrug efflux pump subunit AcrA (membrane-fusion protein)
MRRTVAGAREVDLGITQEACATAQRPPPLTETGQVCVASGTASGRLRLMSLSRRLGVPVCTPTDVTARQSSLVLAIDLSRADLDVLLKDLCDVRAWLLIDSADVDSEPRPGWVYGCSSSIDDASILALVNSGLGTASRIALPAPAPPCDQGDARAARDVLDAVREISVLIEPEAAAASLARSVLSITAADRAWCWFYDRDAGTLYDGSDPDAPQLRADRGLVALSARAQVGVRAATAAQHPAFGGPVDLAHITSDDRVLCHPIVAPDGVCHASLLATRGAARDTFSPSEELALATLCHYAGSVLGQLALRGQIDGLLGDSHGPFRREALDAHDTHADEGDVVRFVPRWLNGAYWVLCALVAVALGFLLIGRVSQYAAGVAVIRADNRVGVVTNVAGTVEAVQVAAGDHVEAGQALARLYSQQEAQSVSGLDEQWEAQLRHYLLEPGSDSVRQTLASLRAQRQLARQRLEERLIRAPRAGTVGEIHTRVGAPLAPGEVVASILDPQPKFQVVAFLPASDAPQIQVGMALRLEVVGYPYAYLQVHVSSVSHEATGAAAVSRHLGPQLADTLAPMPSSVVVEAALDTNHFTVDGRQYPFREGMPARAEVRIRSETIALALVPWMRTLVN